MDMSISKDPFIILNFLNLHIYISIVKKNQNKFEEKSHLQLLIKLINEIIKA